jgi:phage recombination protein Bet
MNEIANVGSENTPITKETIKQYICPKANDQELTLFKELCVSRGLNPFIKEAYLIKYGDSPATMVVGKDVFTKRAFSHKDFNGFKAGVILMRNNEIVYQEGSFKVPGDKLVGGWSEVYRKGIDTPFREEVSMDEYSSGKSNWNKMPLTMIRKVAMVHALREAYPEEFSGLYDESEVASMNDNTGSVRTEVLKKVVLVTTDQAVELEKKADSLGKGDKVLAAVGVNSFDEIPLNKYEWVKGNLDKQISSVPK